MRRRTVLAVTGGILTSGVAGCLGGPPQDATDQTQGNTAPGQTIPAGTWPQVGYDSHNTRHPPDAGGPDSDAEIVWRALGDRPVYPPVVGDACYLTEAWTDGAALALSPEDASNQWTNGELPPIRWAPALQDDRLFVLSRTRENVVRLHALDTTNGEQAWVREAGITASSGEHPPISPTVRDGRVYVASNRGVLACEATAGTLEWTATLGPHVVETKDGPTWRTDWAKPAVTADRAITFDRNENYRATREVYAVDRATGERDWTARLEVGDDWYLTGAAVAGPERIYVVANRPFTSIDGGDSETTRKGAGRLFALEATSGAVVWDWTQPERTLTPPAYANGTLYVGAFAPNADTQRLFARTAADGSSAWTVETPRAVSTPTVAGETVYLSQGERLFAVATADGTRRWELRLGAETGPPVIVDEAAYLRTNPGHNDDSQLLKVT